MAATRSMRPSLEGASAPATPLACHASPATASTRSTTNTGTNSPADTTPFPYSSSDWVTRTGLDARLNVTLAPRDVITVGGALERQAMNGTTLDMPRSRNDGAVYVQVVSPLERSVSLAVGARLEDNQRFGTYATYRTGVSLRIAGGTRAIASVGTGFKEPSFYENFATGFVRGNPDLRPEHSLNWEIGLEYRGLRRTLTARATYFHQRSEEHTSELQSPCNLVCRLLLEKKKN